MAPRIKWSRDLIDAHVNQCMATLGVSRMPSANEMRKAGYSKVACAIARRFGFEAYANLRGLQLKPCTSRMGWKWEEVFATMAESRGFSVERSQRVKSPWDVKVNNLTVNVKAANASLNKAVQRTQWTWRVGLNEHSCDLYALFAIAPGGLSHDLYIVDAAEMPLTCRTMMALDTKNKDRWPAFQRDAASGDTTGSPPHPF